MNERSRLDANQAAYETLLNYSDSTDTSFDLTYEARLVGFAEGWAARQPEVDRLQWTADRLYTEVCRRTPPKPVERPSFAQLERTREEIYGGAR